MGTPAGIASVSLLITASAPRWCGSSRRQSLSNGNSVRRRNLVAARGARLPSWQPTKEGPRLRASVFDDAKKTASDGKAEAGKALGGAKNLKDGANQAKTDLDKVGTNLEEKAADAESEVAAESAETKEKVATAVEDLKEAFKTH